MVFRFLKLQSHNRSTIDFASDALEAAERVLARLMTAADLLEKIGEEGFSKAAGSQDGPIADAISACFQSMNDDFTTAQVLAQLFELSSKINALTNGQIAKEEISLELFLRRKRTLEEFVF